MCLGSRHPDPVTVPAGGTFRYECVVHARRPGPFDLTIRIFLDDNGVRPIDLTATGVAVTGF